jgi:glutamate-1-semialdehyde 2,1-aminomutase
MDLVGPAGKVFMGGTFTAHPVSLAASLATIRELESGEVHEYLFSLGKSIRGKLSELIGDLEIRAQVSGFGSIFKIYFIEPKEKIENYGSLLSNDLKANARFVSGMREKGILIHPHHLKRYHLCAAHTKEDAARFVDAASQVLQLSKDKYR